MQSLEAGRQISYLFYILLYIYTAHSHYHRHDKLTISLYTELAQAYLYNYTIGLHKYIHSIVLNIIKIPR